MKIAATTVLLVAGLLSGGVRAFPGKDIVEEPEIVVSEGLVPEEITRQEDHIAQIEDILLEEVGGLGANLKIVEAEKSELPEAAPKVSYAGSQLWRVVAETKDKKRILVKLRDNKDVAMWGGNVTALDILVKDKSKEKVKRHFEQNNINFDVVIEDVQQAIDTENPPVEEDEELENRQGHRMTWRAYHRLEDIHGYLDYLAQTYPTLCSVQVIGSSVEGKLLKIIKISNGNPGNKAIWIDGGMHAREWISPATVTYIINHLVLNIDSESSELQNLDWYFLPVANPDGYEYSHTTDRLWRKNRAARGGRCVGTDLNRNFGYKWGGKGNSRNQCQETYGGTGPFSEPETAAIKNFISSKKGNLKAYVSFHSYGQYILYPWGYDAYYTTDNADLSRVAQKAASAIAATGGPYYRVGPAGLTLYPASGGSDDWAKGDIGVKYSYTIELRDSGRYGFVLPAAYIKPTANEALAALRIIAQAASTA